MKKMNELLNVPLRPQRISFYLESGILNWDDKWMVFTPMEGEFWQLYYIQHLNGVKGKYREKRSFKRIIGVVGIWALTLNVSSSVRQSDGDSRGHSTCIKAPGDGEEGLSLVWFFQHKEAIWRILTSFSVFGPTH